MTAVVFVRGGEEKAGGGSGSKERVNNSTHTTILKESPWPSIY